MKFTLLNGRDNRSEKYTQLSYETVKIPGS